MALIIAWIFCTIPAIIILSNKNRGVGYVILAILFPLIGLIVALCLSKIEPENEGSKSNDFDISKEH